MRINRLRRSLVIIIYLDHMFGSVCSESETHGSGQIRVTPHSDTGSFVNQITKYGHGEDCTAVELNAQGRWHDMSCMSQYHFVCHEGE